MKCIYRQYFLLRYRYIDTRNIFVLSQKQRIYRIQKQNLILQMSDKVYNDFLFHKDWEIMEKTGADF